jgi:hypothetical protein
MAKGKKTGGRDFAKGVSGNPKGGPGLPKDVKEARKLTQGELERAVNRYLHLSRGELKAAIEAPGTPMIEIMIASIIAQAATKGDQMRLDFILNRIIGKVQDRVEVTMPKPFIIERKDGSTVELGAKVDAKDEE